MKKLLSILAFALFTSVATATVTQTVAVTSPGQLGTQASAYRTTVTNLTVTGAIDARDLFLMRDYMPALTVLNLSGASIAAWTGSDVGGSNYTYPANEMPMNSFYTLMSGGTSKTTLTSIILPSGVTSIGANALRGCTGISGSLIIPASVTIIGDHAFSQCNKLTDLTLSASCVSIAANAFLQCSGLKGSFSLPASVTTIGDYAFGSCGFTGSLNIPNLISNMGIGVFTGCTGFTGNLNVPSWMTSIPDATFNGCTGLSSLTLPTGLVSIGGSAFAYCSGLKGSLTFPAGLTSIGGFAFRSCAGFTGGLILPESLISIGDYAFCESYGFTGSLTIPNAVTTIGSAAFQSCSNITGSITIGSSLSSMYPLSFGWTRIINYIVNPANANYSSLDGVLYNKMQTTLVSYPQAKSGNFVLPASVTSILSYAFSGCGISILTFPNSNVNIAAQAFYQGGLTINCLSATPPTVVATSFSMLQVANVFVPSDAAVIAYKANVGWIGNFPGTIIKTGYAASVTLSSAGALSTLMSATEKSNATSLALTGTIDARDIKTIRDNMPLLSVLDLSRANIVAYNGSEGTDPFGSSYLANEMPNSSFFNNTTFAGKTSLKTLTLPNTLTSIGNNALQSCTGLSTLALPTGLVNIGNSAFFGCSGIIASISFPTGMTSIGASAFFGCTGLTGLTLPPKLTSMGDDAFNGCSGLLSITALNSTPPTLGAACFSGNAAVANVFVLTAAAITDYKANALWYGFFPGSIIKSSIQTLAVSAAGNLSTQASAYLSTVINLTLTGNIDARDVKTLRDNMPQLAVLDLSGATIVAYTGTAGTYQYGAGIYLANVMPQSSFMNPSNGVGKTSLVGVKLPITLVGIDGSTFASCSNLSDLMLPSGVQSIKSQAFYNCSSLGSLTFPASMTTLEANVFLNCANLTAFQVESGNANFSSLDGVLFNKDQSLLIQYPAGKLGSYTAPSTVSSISDQAFANCKGLTEVNLPAGLTTLGMATFSGCTGLTSFNLPAAITSIPNSLFANCTNLKSLTCAGSTPPSLGTNCFYNVTTLTDVFVPSDAAVTDYKASSAWIAAFPGDIIKLNVATALPSLGNGKVKVYTTASEIVIVGLSQSTIVELYNLNGRCLQSRKALGDRLAFSVQGHGVYLVRVEGKTFKVIL